MQTNQSKKTNRIVDFVFEFSGIGFFDGMAFPPQNGSAYSSDEIRRLKEVKSALDVLNLVSLEDMQCKPRIFTQQDLDNMGE